uniref:Uncharacterized protein n=1 Tax=Picea glauca TaxID=3330 RepID=A0A101M0U5_PICGL|nr:hypothetical protein ABT39_MTgene4203 [Picea glauca]
MFSSCPSLLLYFLFFRILVLDAFFIMKVMAIKMYSYSFSSLLPWRVSLI